MRRRHHIDVAVDGQVAFALLAAGVGAVEDAVVFGLEVRRAFQRHRTANMVVGRFDIFLGKAQGFQQVKRRVVQLFGRDAKDLRAELLAQCPLVEDKADVEGLCQRRVDLGQLVRAKTVADQRGVVDRRRVADGAVTDSIADDFFDLGRAVAKLFKRCRHRLVDDLEIATARELLEFHQRKVRLDPGGIAIHHQTDGARRRNHRGLRVAVPVLFAKPQGFVPGRGGDVDQVGLRAVCVIQWHGLDR